MERFSQFRDKGTSIAPFLPIPTDPSGIYLPVHLFLFAVRIPFLLAFGLSYFVFLQWLPIGAIGKKASLWATLGIPGIWWIDLQIDGVKKGYSLYEVWSLHLLMCNRSLSQNSSRLPQAGSVIASSSASPIDALYISAIFDPIFTASYPSSRLVEQVSLFQAMLRAFASPRTVPPEDAKLVDLATLLKENPHRIVVVFPECTTSNGRGILPFSPSLLGTPPKAKVFPVNLRYTPADITSPLPHSYVTFLWNLCSKPTHCIRIRIAEAIYNNVPRTKEFSKTSSYTANYFDQLEGNDRTSDEDTLVGSDELDGLNRDEKAFLDHIGEALARLGRIKRVGLGVREKIDFVKMWARTRR